MSERTIIVGDLHGCFDRLNNIIAKENPSIILQCGDFGYWPRIPEARLEQIKTQNTKIYFCDGNNDDLKALFDLKKDLICPIEVSRNIFYMPRGSILELPDKRTVLFMGGASSIDRDRREEGWDWFPQEIISQDDLDNLPDKSINILISHTCPEEFKIEQYHRMRQDIDPSRRALSQVLKKYQPDQWYFGHWHFYAEGQYTNTSWQALSWIKEFNSCYRIL